MPLLRATSLTQTNRSSERDVKMPYNDLELHEGDLDNDQVVLPLRSLWYCLEVPVAVQALQLS